MCWSEGGSSNPRTVDCLPACVRVCMRVRVCGGSTVDLCPLRVWARVTLRCGVLGGVRVLCACVRAVPSPPAPDPSLLSQEMPYWVCVCLHLRLCTWVREWWMRLPNPQTPTNSPHPRPGWSKHAWAPRSAHAGAWSPRRFRTCAHAGSGPASTHVRGAHAGSGTCVHAYAWSPSRFLNLRPRMFRTCVHACAWSPRRLQMRAQPAWTQVQNLRGRRSKAAWTQVRNMRGLHAPAWTQVLRA